MDDGLQGLNIFLIGMMGSGKTTVGQILAKQLDYRFFDTDVLIERVAGKTINEIFATDGEDFFRDLESKILEELSPCTRSAIATGGGIVLRQQNWSHLKQGLIVWLDVPVEVLVSRLTEDKTRPLLKTDDLTLKLTKLLEERHSRYAEADLRIPITANQTPEDIVDQIIAKIPTVLKTENNLSE